MSATSRIAATVAVLLGLGGAAAMTQPAPPRQDNPDGDPLLTERMPFCETLARKVATLQRSVPAPHAEADWLAREGNRMCAIGHVQQGIRRLRGALVELMEQDGEH